jgi:hypothetical protein
LLDGRSLLHDLDGYKEDDPRYGCQDNGDDIQTRPLVVLGSVSIGDADKDQGQECSRKSDHPDHDLEAVALADGFLACQHAGHIDLDQLQVTAIDDDARKGVEVVGDGKDEDEDVGNRRYDDDSNQPLVLFERKQVHFGCRVLTMSKGGPTLFKLPMAKTTPISTTRDKFEAHKGRFADHGLDFVEVDTIEEVEKVVREKDKDVKLVFVIRDEAATLTTFAVAFLRSDGNLLGLVQRELMETQPDFAKLDRIIPAALQADPSLPCDARHIPVPVPTVPVTLGSGSGSGSGSTTSSPSSSISRAACFVTSFGPVVSLALRNNCPSYASLLKGMVTLEVSPWIVLTSLGHLFTVSELLDVPVSDLLDGIHEDSVLRRVVWDLSNRVDRRGWVSVVMLEDYGGILSVSVRGNNVPEQTRDLVEAFAPKLAHHNHVLSVSFSEEQKGRGGEVSEEAVSVREVVVGEEEEEERTDSGRGGLWRAGSQRLAEKLLAFDKLLGKARTVGL